MAATPVAWPGGYALCDIASGDSLCFAHQAAPAAEESPKGPKGVMMDGEFQSGRRTNNSDGFQFNEYWIQFSFKCNFAFTLEGH